jgi:hypothetical protein
MARIDTFTFNPIAFAIAAIGVLLFALPANAYEKGEPLVTQGLVCDQASEVDAVVTLALSGENLQTALAEVNHGAERPRCVTGVIQLAQYVKEVHTFYIKDNAYYVHEIEVLGVGMKTMTGIMAKELESPVRQYVVSTRKATGA